MVPSAYVLLSGLAPSPNLASLKTPCLLTTAASFLPPSISRLNSLQRGGVTFLFLSSCWLRALGWMWKGFHAEWDPTAPWSGPNGRSAFRSRLQAVSVEQGTGVLPLCCLMLICVLLAAAVKPAQAFLLRLYEHTLTTRHHIR